MEGGCILMEIIEGLIPSAVKCCIYGPEGIGKSTFASKFPHPLFIDTEGSTKRLSVRRTPAPSSWSMLLEQVKYVRDNPQVCRTLVVDTADWAERMCEQAICDKAGKHGIEDFGYGKGYTYLAEEFGRLLNYLTEIVDRGVHVVFTAHAATRKFEQPDELGSYDRWEMKLEKKTAPLLREWADMVLFANYKTFVITPKNEMEKKKVQGGKRVMYTTHHPCWDAKNRHELKDELPFEYQQIAHCIDGQGTSAPAAVSLAGQTADAVSLVGEIPEPSQQRISDAVSLVDDAYDVDAVLTPQTTSADAVSLVGENSQTPAAVSLAGKSDEWVGIPKALRDLMESDDIYPHDIRAAVAAKGYYPESTPIEKYDPGFVNGVLIGAWPQVRELIQQTNGPLPF